MKDDDGAGPCRLIELRASNFMRLTAVDIRPTGQVVEITGRNGEGKTSVLRAFWAAVKGKAALQGIAPVAIHQEKIARGANKSARGENGADLYLDLGRVQITRSVTRGETGDELWSLKLAAGDRRITSKPQAMLDAIVGDGLTLDPLEFARWDAKRQFDALRRLVPDFDFEAAAEQRAALFAERTDVNREAKRAHGAAASIRLPEGPEPGEADVAALTEALGAALAQNEETNKRRARREALAAEIDAKHDEAERLRARAATLERDADAIDARLAAAEPLPDLIDTAAITLRMRDAQATAQARQAFADRRRHLEEARTAEQSSEDLTRQIAELDAAKAAAIAAAKLPVPGLALGDGVVLLNDLPFSQASTAEKIKAAMAIAMATAGDLKVICIDEGSELDSNSLALIEGMVDGTDFVVMICRVDETGERGWVIEDGRVARAPGRK